MCSGLVSVDGFSNEVYPLFKFPNTGDMHDKERLNLDGKSYNQSSD